MSSKQNLPVLLVAWNRPGPTRMVLQAVADYQPSALYFAQDGPRGDVASDEERCAEVRGLLEKVGINCPIYLQVSKAHIGLKDNVLRALQWFFSNVPAGVVLEDDIVPTADFFLFCEELLERYRGAPIVSAISGSNHAVGFPLVDDDYYFSSFQHVWGFASWSRVWNDFSGYLENLSRVGTTEILELFPDFSEHFAKHWVERINGEIDGSRNTWSAIWNYYAFSRGLLSVVPRQSLVENIGFGEQASNSKRIPLFAGYPPRAGALRIPLKHPTVLSRDERRDAFVASTQWNTQHKLVRVVFGGLEFLRRIVHRFGGFIPVGFLFRLVTGQKYDESGQYLTIGQMFFRRYFSRKL